MSLAVWVVVLGSVGAGQGVLLGGALLARRVGHQANVFLAALLLALTGLMVGDVLRHSGAVRWVPALDGAFDGLLLALGPALWLYVRRLIAPGWRPRWGVWPHFIPAIYVSLGLWLSVALGDTQGSEPSAAQSLAEDPIERLQLALAAIQMSAYLLSAGVAVHRWRRLLTHRFSKVEGRQLHWLVVVLTTCAALLVIWLLSWGSALALADLMSSAALTAGILTLGVFGLRQQPLPALHRAVGPRVEPAVPPVVAAALAEPLAGLRDRLETLMHEEKLFLEDDLSLGDVCNALEATPHHVSHVLNTGMGMSFYDYVNGLRVREVQRCLHDPAFDGQTVLEIALASGFASKATFNAVFKKHAGSTPSAFRKTRTLHG